jgi:hypothetical protein
MKLLTIQRINRGLDARPCSFIQHQENQENYPSLRTFI